MGSSDCFISSVEHVIPWESTTRAGPPRPGTEFAVCWCSELARVGVDLARGRLLTRSLGRAGCLSTPTGVWIKWGAQSLVGFGPGVGSVRYQVSLVLGTRVLQELGAVFRNFYGLMRYGILQHDPQVRLAVIFRLGPIYAFERRRLAARAVLENRRFLTRTPIDSALSALTPPLMVILRS